VRSRAVLLSALLVAACGGGLVTPSPRQSRSSASATATSTITPGPSPTSLSSAKGFITVRQPLANARVSSPVTISGDASVFEATLQWRITDSAGRILAQGHTTASVGAPGRGTFSITATFASPLVDTIGIVEVFERSARDGSIDEIVRVPVVVSR
jgi:hypothetical protein